MLFRSNDTATTEIYTRRNTLSLLDALPISGAAMVELVRADAATVAPAYLLTGTGLQKLA